GPGVGGHGMGDWTRGRLYRLTPKGHKGYKVPEVKLEPGEGFRQALGSPNLAVRHMAVQQIKGMELPKGLEVLFGSLQGKPDSLLTVRVLWLWTQLIPRLEDLVQDRWIGEEKKAPSEEDARTVIALIRMLKARSSQLSRLPEKLRIALKAVATDVGRAFRGQEALIARELLLCLRDDRPEFAA